MATATVKAAPTKAVIKPAKADPKPAAAQDEVLSILKSIVTKDPSTPGFKAACTKARRYLVQRGVVL